MTYKCVSCGKPVPQIANKKHRLYCNDRCRIAFKRKAKANNKSEQIKSEQPEIKSEQAKANSFEKCIDCGKNVLRLHVVPQHPTTYPTRCSVCASKQEIKSKQSGSGNLEKCRYCGKDLPALSHPRGNLGACYECALKQPTKRSEPLDPHFAGELTEYEAQHYKPAEELHAHEFNPVSKPGDEHYLSRRCIHCGEQLDTDVTTCQSCIDAGALKKGLTPISSEDCE